MIERYSITLAPAEMAERFSVEVPEFYQPRFNAAPTQLLPVITSHAPKGLSLFYWGTSPEWSKHKMPGEKIINTRIEHFEEKPALKRALMKTRCLIPADGFYSWKKVGKKTSIPYRFVLTNGDTFSFGGLWEEFEDTEGVDIHTFSMITVPASPVVGQINERMPLILSKENEEQWLHGDADETSVFSMMRENTKVPLNFYPVSPGISNTDRNLPSMILPTPPSDQHGNLTLFD